MCNIYIKVEQGVESYSKRNCYACACKKSKKSVRGMIGAIGENGTPERVRVVSARMGNVP